MKDPIILITNSCPFHGEFFLRNELEYVPADQQVILFPILPEKYEPLENWDKPHIRVVANGAFPSATDKLAALVHAVVAPFRNGELREILRKPNPARNFLKAIKFAWLSDSRARAVHRWLKANPISGTPTF